MTTEVQPLGDRVLIEPDAPEKQIGVLIIPDASKQKSQTGKIVQVGEGVKKHNSGASGNPPLELPILKQGQSVMFGKHAGVKITLNGKDHLIMRESEIFAIIKNS